MNDKGLEAPEAMLLTRAPFWAYGREIAQAYRGRLLALGHARQDQFRRKPFAYHCWRESILAQSPKRFGPSTFRQFSTRSVAQELVVPIDWSGQVKDGLQQAVQARRHKEVLTPNNIGYALKGIVNNDGDMIACRNILA